MRSAPPRVAVLVAANSQNSLCFDRPEGVMTTDWLSLAEVLAELRATYGDNTPSYHVLRVAVAEGRVPACKLSSLWVVARADLERAAHGLRLPAVPPRAA